MTSEELLEKMKIDIVKYLKEELKNKYNVNDEETLISLAKHLKKVKNAKSFETVFDAMEGWDKVGASRFVLRAVIGSDSLVDEICNIIDDKDW